MKKLFAIIMAIVFCQSVFCQMECGYEQSGKITDRSIGNIANGGVFTPKGDFRVLVIFISYGGIYDTLSLDGWNNGAFPDWATSVSEKAFYNDYFEFPQNIYSDNNRKSVSNFYYQMSKGQFRLVASYYPQVVTVDPSTVSSLGQFHKKVLDQIPITFNWNTYDNRTNKPNFSIDNSNSSSDGTVDYVIFCHRFSREWPSMPSLWLEKIKYDGISSTFVSYSNEIIRVKDGFTWICGTTDPIEMFPHELGHNLYDGPHYSGGNYVAGDYFYIPFSGWGMMHLSQSYTCATGWERYILDWSPQIMASGICSDISSCSDLSSTNGVFILRDFITTGDAIRIRVPSEIGTYQYLWLENHQCISTFDGNFHDGFFCTDSIDEYKHGLVAYVESYSHVKDTNYINLYNNGNGIRWLSKDGDYDFGYYSNPIHPQALCYNKTYPFFWTRKNVLGGQSNGELIRHDFDNNGCIQYNSIGNNGNIYNTAKNECEEVIQLNDELPTAKYYTGTGLQFHCGDKVGISRNPCVRNIPKYDSIMCKMGAFFLNGISFELIEQGSDGSITVRVKLDDVVIDNNTRWAASSIVLPNITNDLRPDIDVQPYITIDIDRSGTPNRHKVSSTNNQLFSNEGVNRFITPTTFSCLSNSFFRQESLSIVNVRNMSTLVLDSGSLYEICDNAVLNINATGTLIVKSGAILRVRGAGHVEIQNGAYICVENGATIELVDSLSAINLRHGCQYGINPVVTQHGCECTTSHLANYILNSGSCGHINEFENNYYIQNIIYNGKAYEVGDTVWVGYNVTTQKPQGDVLIEDGAHVIMDAENEVKLESGVSVKQGALFEIR